MKINHIIQHNGVEIAVDTVEADAKTLVKNLKLKAKDVVGVTTYIKPEDGSVYAVIAKADGTEISEQLR